MIKARLYLVPPVGLETWSHAKHGSTETSLAWLGTVWHLLGWRLCALCLGEEKPDYHQNKADMFLLTKYRNWIPVIHRAPLS